MSSVDIPFATRLTTSETVIRIPRIQARPPITAGSNVIRSNIGLVYQPEDQSENQGPRAPRAGARVWSGLRTSEVKHLVTSELEKTDSRMDFYPQVGLASTSRVRHNGDCSMRAWLTCPLKCRLSSHGFS